jgi:HEPN domain-containing protein
MKNKPLHQQWLDRARSNLERARAGKISRHVLYEDICFDCQQAVEKSFKALLVFNDIKFPWTHNIGTLIKTLEDNQIQVPENIKESSSLTVYAVNTRYPGDKEPIEKKESLEAFSLAEEVFKWVKKNLK